jgi:flagellar hook protein FlgE
VGNNLANLNTVGFKASTVSFRDLISQNIGIAGRPSQVGLGVNRPSVVRQFTQGSIQNSSGPLDAAIQGDGFFVARNGSGSMVYSRAGNFHLDANGNLLSATGEALMGWVGAAGNVATSGPITNIRIPFGALRPPTATARVSLDANLNAATEVNATFSTPMEVIDSLGSSHVMTVTFTKTAANAWSYKVTIPGEELTSGTAGTPSEVATGTLTFNDRGILTAPAPPPPASNAVEISLSGFKNGAANLAVKWDMYKPDGSPRLTQFSQTSATSANAQDGAAAAQLVRVGIGEGGQVLAQYSNGQELAVAQLALASVVNPDSMVAIGNNNFMLGGNTSAAAIGLPGTGGRGEILGSALEASTVDIAKEFTNLIVYQRGYQANSRMITTLDELSQETLNLKR